MIVGVENSIREGEECDVLVCVWGFVHLYIRNTGVGSIGFGLWGLVPPAIITQNSSVFKLAPLAEHIKKSKILSSIHSPLVPQAHSLCS